MSCRQTKLHKNLMGGDHELWHVYSKDGCNFCKKAKELLTNEGYPFEVTDMTDESKRSDIYKTIDPIVKNNKKFCQEKYRYFPMVMYNSEFIGGYTELEELIKLRKSEEGVDVGHSLKGGVVMDGGESTGGESTGGESTDGESTGGESTGGESTDGESTDGEIRDWLFHEGDEIYENTLTGQSYQTLLIQMMKMDDNTLQNMCMTDKTVANACLNDEFWKLRLLRDYGYYNEHLLVNGKWKDTWKEWKRPPTSKKTSSDGKLSADLWENSNGVLHREGDFPAQRGPLGVYWYVNGRRSRDGDEPAAIVGGLRWTKAWYRDGVKRRDGGKPSIIRSDGYMAWTDEKGLLHTEEYSSLPQLSWREMVNKYQ
jgi:glutaredoxin